jgi:hypothetical protein
VRPKDHERGGQPQQIEGAKPMLDGRSCQPSPHCFG